MVGKSPKDRVVPLPTGLFMAHKGVLLITYGTWDDPPSTPPQFDKALTRPD